MVDSKNFFFRLEPAQYLAAIIQIPEAERGQWAIQLGIDLAGGVGTTDFSKQLIAEADNYRKNKALAGQKGGLAKASSAKAKASSATICSSKTLAKASTPLASSSNSNSTEKTKKLDGFQPPLWLPEKPWEAFVKMRKEIKKPLSQHAMQLAFDKLETLMEQGNDPAAVLNQSTFNSWQGLFAVKDAPAVRQEAESQQDKKAMERREAIRRALPVEDL